MDEGDRSDMGRGAASGTVLAQAAGASMKTRPFAVVASLRSGDALHPRGDELVPGRACEEVTLAEVGEFVGSNATTSE